MNSRVDSRFKKELSQYGLMEWNGCYHCGTCTAICPLTENENLFPRRTIRLAQMGLKDSLKKSVDPWLCYYCGECSETCPRDANPGELMMILRRYLTSAYDWTGISRLFYTRKIWELLTICIIAVAIIAGFLIFLPLSTEVWTQPGSFINEQGGVLINSLSSRADSHMFMRVIETADMLLLISIAGLLISNIFHMFYRVILSDRSLNIPLWAYFTEFWTLIYNFVTQARFSKCDNRTYWFGHLLLMTSYTIMFVVIIALLPKFQTEEVVPWYNWQRILGYYATFGLLSFLIYTFIGRIRKRDLKMRFSHPSDWLFIILLFLTTVSGILVHIFRLTGLPAATYYTYIIHLAILFPMILVEVPFSKWSHLAYRPFAIYFNRLKHVGHRQQLDINVAKAI